LPTGRFTANLAIRAMARMLAAVALVLLPLAVLAAPTVREDGDNCHPSGNICAFEQGFPFVAMKNCCNPDEHCVPVLSSGEFRCGTVSSVFSSSSLSASSAGPASGNGGPAPVGPRQLTSGAPPPRAAPGTPRPTGSVAPAAASTAPPASTGACGGFRSQRREVMDLSDAEWRRYTDALAALRRSGVYSTFVGYHSTYSPQAHGGCYFLPWHRQYLYEFERALNRVAPGVSIPYWDWTKQSPDSPLPVSQRFTNDPVWGRMGGSNGGSIPNPPFQGWANRGFRTGTGNRGAGGNSVNFPSSREVGTLSRSNSAYIRFANTLEGIHAIPHVAIGGTMAGVPISPTDPIFWSHHAFVDKIYRDWQNSGSGNSFGGTHSNPTRTCTLQGERMNPPIWARTVRQILEDVSQCVTYAPSSRAGPSARFDVLENASSARQSATSGFGGTSASASSSALVLSSEAELQTYHAQIAKKKIEEPLVYEEEVKRGVDIVDTLAQACKAIDLPEELSTTATEAYRVLLLRLGVDVVNDRAIVGSSAESIVSEGHAQASASSVAQASSSNAQASASSSAQASSS
jgi:Common central domain of tyrosinase